MSLAYRSYIARRLPVVERACRSKALFVSRREASTLSRHGRLADERLHPYRCRYCRYWHLGHRPGSR